MACLIDVSRDPRRKAGIIAAGDRSSNRRAARASGLAHGVITRVSDF
jgi:hypothetical protein